MVGCQYSVTKRCEFCVKLRKSSQYKFTHLVLLIHFGTLQNYLCIHTHTQRHTRIHQRILCRIYYYYVYHYNNRPNSHLHIMSIHMWIRQNNLIRYQQSSQLINEQQQQMYASFGESSRSYVDHHCSCEECRANSYSQVYILIYLALFEFNILSITWIQYSEL